MNVDPMKKTAAVVLGYTRTGRAVLLPDLEIDADCSDGLLGTMFMNWTWGDHLDTALILTENGERESDPSRRSRYVHWTRVHRFLAQAARRFRVRGAAEGAILPSSVCRPSRSPGSR